jgi:hypothetical protein
MWPHLEKSASDLDQSRGFLSLDAVSAFSSRQLGVTRNPGEGSINAAVTPHPTEVGHHPKPKNGSKDDITYLGAISLGIGGSFHCGQLHQCAKSN